MYESGAVEPDARWLSHDIAAGVTNMHCAVTNDAAALCCIPLLQIRFKPLGKEVRNVRCMRCGKWGHRSGDRECSMRNENPLDAERLARNDPLTYMREVRLALRTRACVCVYVRARVCAHA